MYPSGTNKLIEDDIDKAQLDKMAEKNPMVKSKQLDVMLNMLRKTASMFPYYSESKVQLMAERLQNQGYGCLPLEAALSKILDREDNFPSYKIILDMVRANTPRKSQNEDRTEQIKENEKFLRLKSEFSEKLGGGEKLELFAKWWVKEVLQCDVKELGYNPVIFLRCALFDWHDSGFSGNFERIKLIGRNKQIEVKKRLAKIN